MKLKPKEVEALTDLPEQRAGVFWGEIAPCEHLVQIYTDDVAFLDTLEGFVGGGLHSNDAVVVIMTPSHRVALEVRLRKRGFDLTLAATQNRYISLDAEETLSKFVIQGWPDDALFSRLVTALISRARENGRPVRVFGEMVALLWAQGHNGATVRLEHLWHQFCKAQGFSLFCAYPRSGFTEDANDSMRIICAAHSKVIGEGQPVTLAKPSEPGTP